MQLSEVVKSAIEPALSLLPDRMDSAEARVMLLAIGLQESRFIHRRQIVSGRPIGPAKSFWQGEKTGGMVRGVRIHPATKQYASALYAARGVASNETAIWDAIETDDVLAAGLARLLLFSDPRRLPSIDDSEGAWDLYNRTWRPGKPHRQTWDSFHAAARQEVLS